MIDQQLLLDGCEAFGITLPQGAAEKLDRYAQLLVEWNQKMNLTAITEPREIVYKHFVDSLLLLKAIELPQGASLIDVGTGAGFPSMPVKIAREDLKVTLLDSLQKRLTFLQEVNVQLGLDCAFIHARAEDGGKDKKLREQFDFASARAVTAGDSSCTLSSSLSDSSSVRYLGIDLRCAGVSRFLAGFSSR